jgi:hypothetical protein
MNLAGIADPLHGDRSVVDLLFFPTGGGKTEAYLGLAAFAWSSAASHPGLAGAGVGVLMRYTLRLLTLDQLGRAATLICALELERQKDPQRLGPWPFEIGLWVGQSATPNEMGSKGDSRPTTARARVLAYQRDDRRHPSPIPLENCPWCGSKFASRSFRLVPTPDQPRALEIRCIDRDCLFTRNAALPIVAVDEPLYRRLPCFIIATVDKFAASPGSADRRPARQGRPRRRRRLLRPRRARTRPPAAPAAPARADHSGRAAPDLRPARHHGRPLRDRPRRALRAPRRRRRGPPQDHRLHRHGAPRRAQIQALFGRTAVDVFPPPGPDRARFVLRPHPRRPRTPASTSASPARAARSRSSSCAATSPSWPPPSEAWYDLGGGKKNPDNPADPYMTLLGYFNSLRELGGSRRIVEDEVNARLAYGERRRDGEASGSFADRNIDDLPQELTSRVAPARSPRPSAASASASPIRSASTSPSPPT